MPAAAAAAALASPLPRPRRRGRPSYYGVIGQSVWLSMLLAGAAACLLGGRCLLVVGYEGRRRDRPANDAANGQQQQGSVCASVCMVIWMGRQHLLKGGRLGPSKEHACTQHRKQGTRGKSGRGVGDASAKAKLTRKRRVVCDCVYYVDDAGMLALGHWLLEIDRSRHRLSRWVDRSVRGNCGGIRAIQSTTPKQALGWIPPPRTRAHAYARTN